MKPALSLLVLLSPVSILPMIKEKPRSAVPSLDHLLHQRDTSSLDDQEEPENAQPAFQLRLSLQQNPENMAQLQIPLALARVTTLEKKLKKQKAKNREEQERILDYSLGAATPLAILGCLRNTFLTPWSYTFPYRPRLEWFADELYRGVNYGRQLNATNGMLWLLYLSTAYCAVKATLKGYSYYKNAHQQTKIIQQQLTEAQEEVARLKSIEHK